MSDTEDVNAGSGEESSTEPSGDKLRWEDIRVPPAVLPACKIASDGPRLIITHIDNHNFKSYAGRQVLGPFHKCFNSIVGPNGSGKSNVIDSMLFVFGYRASKIRSKKLSVLLHSSDKGGQAESCTVSVHFVQIIDKEGESFEVVPNSKIAIARTAFRDNSSYYTLNGKRVQFKAIAQLLRQHGIDLDHNRFLILQGEVEQIAMMKPKGATEHDTGMLEFIEDIVGTTRFKEPLGKLYGIVDKLTEERTEKINRLKIVEKEKNALEKPVNEAIEYLEAENEIVEKRNQMYHKTIYDIEEKLKDFEILKQKTEEELASLSAKLKEIEKGESQFNKEMDALNKEYSMVLKKKEKLKDEFDVISAQDTGYQTEMVQLSKNRKKNKEQLAQEKKKLVDYEAVPEKNEKVIEELKKHEEKLKVDQAKAEAERDKVVANIKAETQTLQDQKVALETKILSRQKETSELKDRFDMAQSALDIYLSTEQKEKAKLENIQANLENSNSSLKEREKEIAELEEKIPLTTSQLQKAKTELQKIHLEEDQQATRLRKIRSQVEENRISMQATRSQGRVLDFLSQQKKRGAIPGIMGRLGDLGAIEAKYDVAVSTACGPLDNIVVDTVETAQACIRALKDHDVGRGTFIALEKQEHLRALSERPISTPENVPRLFDLIKVKDNSVKTAFYYALRDTLVANDLNQASRIAYGNKRYRVVTLEGQLIEVSGTMSGGGRSKLQGRMGNKVAGPSVSPEEQDRLEKEHECLQASVLKLRQRMSSLETDVKQYESSLPQMQMSLKKATMEIQSLKTQLPLLKEQLKQQTKVVQEVKPDPKEVKKLTSLRDSAEEEYRKADDERKSVEKDVKKIHNKIMEITKGRVANAQKIIDELVKKLNTTRQECTKLSVAIKTALRNQKTCKEKISNLEVEIEESAVKLTKIKDEKMKCEEQGKVLLKEMDELAEVILEKESSIVQLKETLPSVVKDKTKLRSEVLEKEQKLESTVNGIQEQTNTMVAYKKKISSLKLHEVPGKPQVELKKYEASDLVKSEKERLQYEISVLESGLTEKTPNLAVLAEYKEKTELFIKRTNELEEVTNDRNQARQFLEEVRQQRLSEFLDGYSIITHKLKEMYQMLTLGGDAELELVDSLDPFSEGIVFSVRPPKKSWKNISNLSGGEKTLSSLALVFALHYYKPSPLFVMDEIDAALDFKNVSIVGNYIKDRTKNAQFIIISLRSNMFELADHLIGIFKTWDCTKSVTISPKIYGKNQDNCDTRESVMV